MIPVVIESICKSALLKLRRMKSVMKKLILFLMIITLLVAWTVSGAEKENASFNRLPD